jgi:tryptophan-rich sensory protein
MPSVVRGGADGLAEGRGRPIEHLMLGLGVAAAAVAGSALAARLTASAADQVEMFSDYDTAAPQEAKASRSLASLVWPPLFLALTASGLRIWNAPRSPARTQALTLWGAALALNAVWMALGPRRLGGQLATAVSTLGTSAAFIWRARRVDAPGVTAAAPYAGWVGFAGALTDELWRKAGPKPTIH